MAVSLRRRFPPISYDADARALFTRMDAAGAPTTAARKVLINDLIVGMKADGDWAELDVLHVYAAHAAAAAPLNWIGNTSTATPAAAPTFTADQGYDLNGSTQYINTNYTPSSDAVNYTQNSAVMGGYLRTYDTDTGLRCILGGNDATQAILLQRNATTGNISIRVNCLDLTSLSSAVFTQQLYSIKRTVSTECKYWIGGTEQTTAETRASIGLPTISVKVGCNDNSGSRVNFLDGQVMLFYAGSGSVSISNFLARINTFLTAIGAI